eukprot:gnl/TRDRNA2_/TRDRNA2_91000_c0_seq2.p1 gnl/TRDRNA2_/TRDRNA2_91000_c0~~gnl/TRDRNA2_/TRDRNA2_91000_c0_seq2.p1  ORF type:complete len:594 (-),score=85.48 gnl/TRDRNA2_/TRDRNA2_91000_c0_seq2:170-1873(-)
MPSGLISRLGEAADHSWLRQLEPDPETERHVPNRHSREVRSGHFVRVQPVPLPKPLLVIHSPSVAEALGLRAEDCASEAFTAFFSGDHDIAEGLLESWCTPYALSIMSQPMYNNCPFGTGNGYGDGRAISVGEVVVAGRRWEMQLKGAGPTPFSRGADGRAVLRSSIREFLASEAMHHLGVDTTRALSLVVSRSEAVVRPWYSKKANGDSWSKDPDTMFREACAITTRVAPSFLRVGHLDLFARRAGSQGASEAQHKELERIVEHALFREYPDVAPLMPFPERAAAMLEQAARRLGTMVAGWLRVGYSQGNFNADNCLIAGRTMDYGPFGFIDVYNPTFAKWTGSGEHFGFMNQPRAAMANLATLANSMMPLLDSAGQQALAEKAQAAQLTVENAVIAMWRRKLGLKEDSPADMFVGLEKLMQKSKVDYTMLFRQLAVLPGKHGASPDAASVDVLLEPLREAFYSQPGAGLEREWANWIRTWLRQLAKEGVLDGSGERMNQINPKYILREYMLVEAYNKANEGDYQFVNDLYELIQNPYDEQPKFEERFYRRAPDSALAERGTSVMT